MKVLISERLSPHKYKTPEGYLICVDAILARTGKQTYKRSELFTDGDDTEIDVDRKPEEVFSKATLASFENKPITVEHPDEDVNSNNIKDYAVGFVRDVHRGIADGQDVILGTLVIQDAETISEIENGEHTELSCGYDCDIDDSANPQQRNIRGNHVALCQCGRAGNARIVDSVIDTGENDMNKDAVIPTKEPSQDRVIYTLQSEIDSNLFFYIGQHYAVKDGQFTYNKFKLDGTTPEQLKNELIANGWKLVGRGYITTIDCSSKDECKSKDEETTHEEVTKKLEAGFDKFKKERMNDALTREEVMERIEKLPTWAREEMNKSSNKKATLLSIENAIEDIMNAAIDADVKAEVKKRGDKIMSDLKSQFKTTDSVNVAKLINVAKIAKAAINVKKENK